MSEAPIAPGGAAPGQGRGPDVVPLAARKETGKRAGPFHRGTHSPLAIRWFGSTALAGHLRHMLAVAAASNQLDLRDWMRPDGASGLLDRVGRVLGASTSGGSLAERLGREVWIDFVADTGDDHDLSQAVGRMLFASTRSPDGSPHAAAGRDARLRRRYRVPGGDRARARAPPAAALEPRPAGEGRRASGAGCCSGSRAITTGTTAWTASGASSAGAPSRSFPGPWPRDRPRSRRLPPGAGRGGAAASAAHRRDRRVAAPGRGGVRVAGRDPDRLQGAASQPAPPQRVHRGSGGLLLGAASGAGPRPLGRRSPARQRRFPTARLLRGAPGRGPAAQDPVRGARSGARLRRAERAGDEAPGGLPPVDGVEPDLLPDGRRAPLRAAGGGELAARHRRRRRSLPARKPDRPGRGKRASPARLSRQEDEPAAGPGDAGSPRAGDGGLPAPRRLRAAGRDRDERAGARGRFPPRWSWPRPRWSRSSD